MIKYSVRLIRYPPAGTSKSKQHDITFRSVSRRRIDAATLQIERMAYEAISAIAWRDTKAGHRVMRAASRAFQLYASGTIKISDCYEIEFWSNKS